MLMIICLSTTKIIKKMVLQLQTGNVLKTESAKLNGTFLHKIHGADTQIYHWH